MDITAFEDRAVAVIKVSGRIDGASAAQAETELLPRAASAPALVLDLQHVDYVSSAGLRVVLKLAKAARARSIPFVLSGLSPQVREVFDISGFSSILAIYRSSAEAVAAVSSAEGGS